MAYGLPSIGEGNWGQKILDSFGFVKGELDGRLSPSSLSASIGRRVSAIAAPYNVPTDGVTDATTALNTWLTALGTDDVGVLPPGTYTATGTVTIPAGASVDLTGVTISSTVEGNALVLSDDVHIMGAYKVVSPTPYAGANVRVGIYASGKNRFHLGSPTVDGFGAFGILLTNCHKFTADAVTVSGTGTSNDGAGGFSGDGFWIGGASSDFTLGDITVVDNGRHGLFLWSNSGASAERFSIGNVLASGNGDTGAQLTNVKNFTLGQVTAVNNGVNGGATGGQGFQIVGDAGNVALYGYGSVAAVTATGNTENGSELHYVTDVVLTGVNGHSNTWSGLAVNNCRDITGAAISCNDNDTEGLSIVGTDGFTFTAVTAHRNNWDGVGIRDASSNGSVTGVRVNNNGQGGGTRGGVVVAACSTVSVAQVEARDTQGAPTQDYGVRVFSCTDTHVRNVRGSGNSVKLVEIDGDSTGWSIDGQATATVATLPADKTGTVGNEPRYYKSDSETVVIEGEFSQGASVTTPTIFTLPVGFRPIRKQTFIIPTYTAAWTFSIIEVRTDGSVFWANSGADRAVMFGRIEVRLGQASIAY